MTPTLLHQYIEKQKKLIPEHPALQHKESKFNYIELYSHIKKTSNGLMLMGLLPQERVAIYLPKQPETVFCLFGTSMAAGVFVPINPLLKPDQVAYILKDCGVRILITSSDRLGFLQQSLATCHDLRSVVTVDDKKPHLDQKLSHQIINWSDFLDSENKQFNAGSHQIIDTDMAAILYTSGSTGQPKGVILSHKNMVAGADSVAQYLKNRSDDRLLAVLPFSFDYGLSQLTTAFSVGASVILMDYLLPRDVLRAVVRYKITGLAAVPALWNQLIQLDWPTETAHSLRYITNSGGAMPKATTKTLRKTLPDTEIYLMYGLTEAFRSTYLPPDQVDIRPESIGKAIPNAEILIVREDGSECAPGEPGELVHRGSLVALGYWNDLKNTSEQFKSVPCQQPGLPLSEIAVWSGDQAYKDVDDYLYFISRKDEMIKTSGYRVSPTEVEEVLYNSHMIKEVVALGVPHPMLGQAILLIATASPEQAKNEILTYCKKMLPNYMVPEEIILCTTLPRNQNGKIDRKQLANEHQNFFTSL
ncbi:MAG: acyl-CoA ligase (AMP-forming), exosortase A system-associated [Candidatus Brocadiaceae bacterium]|nr:acyl-CoA ligase (AMP-forming), exosortase A system-associated [Candidatus Brocadiaceae bacterium]